MFSISDFVRVNRVYLIWLVFAALLYLFRDMFGLVFITYIMCFTCKGFLFISKSIRTSRCTHLMWNGSPATNFFNGGHWVSSYSTAFVRDRLSVTSQRRSS